MTLTVSKPALNLREFLARLAGLEQRMPKPLVRLDFTNLIENGGFDVGLAGWTNNSSGTGTASASSGIATLSYGGGGNVGRIDQSILNLSAHSRAVLQFTVLSRVAYVEFGGIGLGTFNPDVLTLGVTPLNSAPSVRFNPSSAGSGDLTIDNVSLWEADPADNAPWLRLAPGYRVGNSGMIVRDGIILHPSDYTEITRDNQTFIKPIVAPGHDTEFSIWAEVAR